MNRWQDPRIGTYKSAVQKYIRRGEIQSAVDSASGLLRLPGGTNALSRRLSVIAAEDVGPLWIPAVVAITRARRPRDPDADAGALLAAVAGLASLPKSKEAYWLAGTCWLGRRRPRAVSRFALGRAIESGDYREAVAIYMAAREARCWRRGERVIDELLERAHAGSAVAKAVVESALWREGQGGFGIDELAAAAVIAAVDQPDGALPTLPAINYAPPNPARKLDWYVYDGHTTVGRAAIARVAGRRGLRRDALSWLQFNCESIVLGPREEPSRWKHQALEFDAVTCGWKTAADGDRLWQALRDEIRAEIESRVA
jgi:hypothetical protein